MGKKQQQYPDLSPLLSEFNRSLMLIVDKSLLVGNFIARVKTIFPVETVHVFLLDENTGRYKQHEAGDDVSLSADSRIIKWLSVNDKELALPRHPDIVEYFPEQERAMFDRLGCECVFPLKVMNKISGAVFLGRKSDGEAFSGEEISLLTLLFDQAAIAIEHATLYAMQSDRIKRMYRSDRLAILGELAAGAAHEIRNPLTAIRSTIQYISKDFASDAVKSEMVGELIAEVERINKIVQGLLSFARPSELDMSTINIQQLVGQTLLLLNSRIVKEKIRVEFTCQAENALIIADSEQLKQVLLNIMLNAIEAMNENSPDSERVLKINVEYGSPIGPQSRFLIIGVEDTGVGIPERSLENVFNPFFTTKKDGTGLGLAICYGVVNRHGGELEVQSSVGKGTKFTVKIPQQI